MNLFTVDTPPQLSPLISIVIEEKIEEPRPKEYTLEEKIASNYYKCDESIEYIRADTAECLAKPTISARIVENGSQTIENAPKATKGAVADNAYAYGNCTHFAKQLRPDLPNNLGNADSWYINAQAQGIDVGYSPAIGAVAEALTGYMHVAIVVDIDGDRVFITEKNYKGFNIVSSRWVNASDFRYIYK